ncbi:dienelactone hydrolase family protein [Yeosuana sp. MJ-SS3]|uniref:Dienelactone hydrolase family protein n=1 Tax=Gilvirhabdus luticola TaxID=3079858 RepID=A0ABU3U934_9FLAO|nr:dienelactone hydrolase family protein [Yeosuana sp. MJ-SS3]MDU8886927.1 dienelactone hydrolase family protein [Yeosuana sp. MJ-SS3]
MKLKIITSNLIVFILFINSFNIYAQVLHERIRANHKIYIPEGKGNFPVVIVFPGCSGVSLNGPETDTGRPGDEADRLFRRHYSRMAVRLQEAGFLVLLVDYLTAEGVSNTCGWEIHPKRIGEYIYEAVSFAKSIPNGNLTRIHVIGWSHGGEGVLAWLNKLDIEPRDVKSAIAVYPGCSSNKPWKTLLPVLMILGEADDIALPNICNSLVQSLQNKTNVSVISYPNARHGFDLTEGPKMLSVGNNLTIGRNQKAGDDAWNKIFKFLKKN